MPEVEILVQTANKVPIIGAEVTIAEVTINDASGTKEKKVAKGKTGPNGKLKQELPPGKYSFYAEAFGESVSLKDKGISADTSVDIGMRGVALELIPRKVTEKKAEQISEIKEGEVVLLDAELAIPSSASPRFAWTVSGGSIVETVSEQGSSNEVHWDTTSLLGRYTATVTVSGSASISASASLTVLPRPVQRMGTVPVTMRRTAAQLTEDLPLWVVIRNSTEALSFRNYMHFMDHVLCGKSLPVGIDPYEKGKIDVKKEKFEALQATRYLPYTDAGAYRLLKVATEAFLMVNCAVALKDFSFTQIDQGDVLRRVGADGRAGELNPIWQSYLDFVNGTANQTLPYLALIREKLSDVRLKNSLFGEDVDLPEECYGILRQKLTNPCLLELIWSYWHEEGMLVQTMNTISRRFQNIRSSAGHDPLAQLEIDPLRPMNNLLWGYIQDEQHRLTVQRRAYEYDHHYGLRLVGKAVPELRPADSRSKFLEAFHSILHLCSIFYKEDDDTTVIADGFPVLNALRDVHLLLSEGAHNQFGDLPSTARIEMLMQQWLLARPEFREFLPTRTMVAYPEAWQDRVDAMKKLQGWTDVSIIHFRDLGVFGEQVLLSIRYGAWSTVNEAAQASNWARYWRAEIQSYIHAYRIITGVDLTAEPVDYTLPSTLLRERLAMQGRAR